MPEIFRFFGFSFFFYSKEHEPLHVHVHVEGEEGFAKYDYTETGFELRESKDLKASSLKKIKMVIDENQDIIVSRWNEYFNK